MTCIELDTSETLEKLRSYPDTCRIGLIRKATVRELEQLGYVLAPSHDTETVSAVFILASDLGDRFTRLQTMIARDSHPGTACPCGGLCAAP